MDTVLLKGFVNVNFPLKSAQEASDRDSLSVSDAFYIPAFHQEYVKVRRHRLSAKLSHHQCNLAAMVGGMVGHVLHQVC